MEDTLVAQASVLKSLLLTDKFCWTFGTLCRATHVANLEESRLAKLAFENLLELQADKNIQEHQEAELADFVNEIATADMAVDSD